MSFRRFSVFCIFFLWAVSALAQKPRDKAANKKIDEAINQHYLATNFDKAEGILIGTINACGDKCSAPVLARAWMYLGIVRGSGKNDVPGAQEAFAQATALDPAVKLDGELATAKTARAFEAAGGRPNKPLPKPEGATTVKAMSCTPETRALKTHYPIPISCSPGELATKAELSYRAGGGDWKTVSLKKRNGFFQIQVPCAATRTAGTVEVYAKAKNKSGAADATWGSENEPIQFTLADDSEGAVPSFPDKEPPGRCKDLTEDCPPDFPGCAAVGKKGRGSSCSETAECKDGLSCTSGTCEPVKSCESNTDCDSGKCSEGVCVAAPSSSSYKKNWFGVHVAEDLAFLGGSDVCSQDSQANNGFVCYHEGTGERYTGSPRPGHGNNIVSGFIPSTTRFLISYDRAFSPQFLLGARGGYAIGGGKAAANGTAFLPYHFEVRGTFFPLKNSLMKRGFRPYVHIGGGMAQVDAKLSVKAVDCSTGPGGVPNTSPTEEVDCATSNTPSEEHPTVKLDTYKKLGQGFVTFGGGAMYAVSNGVALQLNLNAMFMLPTSGAVIEPSIGLLFGL